MKILDSWLIYWGKLVLSQELDSKVLELKNFWITSFTAIYVEHHV